MGVGVVREILHMGLVSQECSPGGRRRGGESEFVVSGGVPVLRDGQRCTGDRGEEVVGE